MNNKLPPRANMPTISNAAHKMQARSTLYNKPANQETIKPLDQDQEKILADCKTSKQEMLPRLKQLKQILDDATIIQQQAFDNWKNLAQEYEKLDYQEKMLAHKQKVATKVKTASNKKPKSAEEISTNLAMKILANLSPEKQAEILALIKKQGKLK